MTIDDLGGWLIPKKNKLKERAKLTKKYFKCGKKESDVVQITALSN